ncbi:MAG: methylmalonyl Co-A mutase-associated GTPase MeaB [Deferribacteraceae bacterium]|nr:methylmalonyl Co-A mutase-associated GTPase MeaB [Deferribacteraceae bacterium]
MDSFTQRVLDGDELAAARLMRLTDDRIKGYDAYMRNIWRHTGNAHVIGITGAPGAGKSTLVDALIYEYRSKGKTVGVVAIDPSSPFSGGAILGDRIRMSGHSNDSGVFIRSVATRGHLGGLSVSAMDIAAIMDAMGKDAVIIETVGVGQDEIEVAAVADSCVVVTVPGMGDDIQAIKAGILEIADIFVVNKADRDGVERTVKDLETMLSFTPRHRYNWTPPIIKTTASEKSGIDTLYERLEDHRSFAMSALKAEKQQARLLHAANGIIKERVFTELFHSQKLSEAIKNERNDPYTAVEKIWEQCIISTGN